MGSKKSSTTTNTTNEFFDQRQVNDAGGGIIGSRNDLSTNWSSTWEQNNTDSSSKSYSNSGNTTWNATTTDGGAIKGMETVALAQKDLAGQIARINADSSGRVVDAALKSQEGALASVNLANSKAFDFAMEQTKAAFKSGADALGLANKAADGLAGAYSAAASQSNGNKTLTIAAVAAVGLVAAVALAKR